jgi:hypothetical protein
MGAGSSMRMGAWGLAALATGACALCGCGSTEITSTRLERALAPTFANLIETQESMLGKPPLDVSSLRASATCTRIGPGTATSGGGDWQCTVAWFAPGRRGALFDSYELSVTTDGCYTATSDGQDGHLGGPRLTLRNGTTVTNLLYAFDGCFDTT